jgi:NitT/TauT family transport system permease protein
MTRTGELLWSICAILLLIAAWWFGYSHTKFIASPIEVARALPQFLGNPETWFHMGVTFQRLAVGLAAGVILGMSAAFAIHRSPLAHQFLSVYVSFSLRTPSAIAAIMALAMFKRDEIGYMAVVGFITFPFMTVGLLDGLRSADHKLDDVAKIYRVSTWCHVRDFLVPFLAPYTFSALRNAHALAWKIVVVAEIFGAAQEGFGAEFNYAFDYFLLVDLHLWLLVFMALVLFAEYGVLRTLERRVFKWRLREGE